MRNTKYTMFNQFSVYKSVTIITSFAVQPSPLYISRTYSLSQTGTLCHEVTPLSFLTLPPGNHYSIFCLYEFDYARYSTLSGTIQYIWPFGIGLFHLA